MDHAYIEDNQVVDRYLMEKLETAEAARFEAHYLHCQQCLDQLEVAETFLHDFRRGVARQAVQATGILAWLVQHRGRGIALMASALLVAVLVPVHFERRLTEELALAQQPQVNTLVLPLSRERGAASGTEPSRRIRLSASPEWIVFSLELDGSRQLAEAYHVTLLDEGGSEVWRSEAFKPDGGDGLSLSLHSSWLQPGDYQLRAESVQSPDGSASDEPVSATTFSFRVLPNT